MKSHESTMTQNTESQQSDTYVNGIRRISYSEEIEYWEMEKTPFTIVREEKEWMVVLANQPISKGHKDIDAAKEDAEKITWNRIVAVISTVFSHMEGMKEFIKEQIDGQQYDGGKAEPLKVGGVGERINPTKQQ